jgi:hypothetical protein
VDWIGLEISLVKAFSWSLADIDATDIESLIPFIRQFGGEPDESLDTTTCDQVDWF